jgi:uncharacterized protein YegP (UPF0339 family)
MGVPYFTIYRDEAMQWRWILYGLGDKRIAVSGQGYPDRDQCVAAVHSVRLFASGAYVKELNAG